MENICLVHPIRKYKQMKKLLSILIVMLFIASCNEKAALENSYELADGVTKNEAIPMLSGEADEQSTPIPVNNNQNSVKKKIIKDGRMGMEVQDLEKSKKEVDDIVKKYQGYYANERLSNSERETSYYLKIRVPGNNFEKLVSEIETGSGEITSKEVDARDVTEQFIDLETRLANKKNYLKRYNDLLQKAKSINEILQIEEKIRRIEEEIESTTGRLKYLSDQVDFSTLDLEITQLKDYKYKTKKRDNFPNKLKHALTTGWYGFVDFIVVLINIWPFWVIAALVIFLWKRLRTRKKGSNN